LVTSQRTVYCHTAKLEVYNQPSSLAGGWLPILHRKTVSTYPEDEVSCVSATLEPLTRLQHYNTEDQNLINDNSVTRTSLNVNMCDSRNNLHICLLEEILHEGVYTAFMEISSIKPCSQVAT
jgi:hypothetical protein